MNSVVAKTNTYNVTCTNADTEYSQALPYQTSYFFIKCRQDNAELKFCEVSGASGTNFTTIPAGGFYWEYGKRSGSTTLYFQTPVAGTIVEIKAQVS